MRLLLRLDAVVRKTRPLRDVSEPEAERYARKALEADTNFRDARNALGAVLINEGRYKEALEE